jgi:hypothetical protein
MLHYATNKANQSRVRQLLKRARLDRAHRLGNIDSPSAARTGNPLRDSDDGTYMSDVPSSMPANVLTDSLRKELTEIGRHFSKIASRFVFENDAAAYNAWVIQFKAEAENHGLEDVLTDAHNDTPLAKLRQKTVYHMILSCVPKAVLVSVTNNLRQHTAYEAWRTLRRHYIGDEATYLQGLETRFNRVSWLDTEEFPAFEIRFNQLATELEAGGQGKTDHVKKSVFLHAIESSNKKDAHGVHVFNRLNTTSQIHYSALFPEWMVYMRVEAQHIHDSVVAHRGIKRPRENHAADSPHHDATPISYVAPPTAAAASTPQQYMQRPPPFRAQRNGNTSTTMCRDFQKGSCRFGARCKFSHNSAAGSTHQQKSNEICNNFRQGRCPWGDKCRYVHSEPTKEEPPAMPHLLRHVAPSGAITFENANN